MQIDLELLSIQNPWWSDFGSLKFDPVIESYDKQSLKWKPEVLSEFDLGRDNIYVLHGLRNVGKTTILKLLIKGLIEKNKVNPDNIFYYSCHNLDTYEQLNELIKIFLNWRRSHKPERLFIFIDEASLIKNWQKGINFLLQSEKLKGVTLVLSSSILNKDIFSRSKAAQKLKNRQNRIITSMGFSEFLNLMNSRLAKRVNKKNYQNFKDQLEYYLDIYFLTGGLISVVNEYKENGFVGQATYDNYLYWLIADMAKLDRDVILMRQILENILSNLGDSMGYKTIARQTKAKTHLTVLEYLNILERMFFIKAVYQSDEGKPTSRKAKKIYFRDPFVFWLFYSYIHGSLNYWQFSRERLHRLDIFSLLVENVIFSHLIRGEALDKWGERVTYWRDNIKKQEINFLLHEDKKTTPVLVKYNDNIASDDKKILKQAGFEGGIIISRNKLNLRDAIKIMPLTYFLLFH